MSEEQTYKAPNTPDILIFQGGKQLGPMSWDEVNSAIIRGEIDVPNSFAWFPGIQDWIPLGNVEGPYTSIGTHLDHRECTPH